MVTGLFNANFPMLRLRGEMDRVLDRVLDEFPQRGLAVARGQTFPAVNVWEDGEQLFAEAEIPGIGMNDLEITVIGDELTIRGERKDSSEKDVTFHRRERGVGGFKRVFRLPIEVDADRVTATLNSGVLRIALPKAEVAKPRKIEVKCLTV